MEPGDAEPKSFFPPLPAPIEFILTPLPPNFSQSVGPDPADSEGEALDLRRWWDALRKRAWLVGLLAVVAGGLSAIQTTQTPRLYRTQASLVIEASAANVLTGVANVVQMGSGSYWANEAYYEKEMEVVRSRAVARRAGEMLGIVNDDAHNGLAEIEDGAERERLRAKMDPADLLVHAYEVEGGKTPSVVEVKVVGLEPERTAQIANAVVDAYIELNLERHVNISRDASTWLGVQHGELKTKLEHSEDTLYQFMEDNDVLNASLESQLEEVHQRLVAFNSDLASVQAERIKYSTKEEVLKEVSANPEMLDSLIEIREASIINDLKGSYIELLSRRAELAGRYQVAHPKMQNLQKQIELIKRNLDHETASVLSSLQRHGKELAETEAGLARAIAKERRREARLNKLSIRYNRLEREVKTNDRLYTMVTSRMKEADLTGALRVNNVRVLDSAQVPRAPFKPNVRRNILLGILLGMAAGIAFAFAFEVLDNTLKTQDDITQNLKVPFLGLLPVINIEISGKSERDLLLATRKRDLFVMDHPRSSPAECARFLRTNLLFMTPDKPLRTLVVTSASPQEGKTTTAVSLAVVMAQSGSRTLIVDTDMRRPRLHRSFGVSNDVGLSSVIVGDATLDEAVQATDAPGLEVLVCGPIPPNPAELLHTDRFAALIKQLQDKFDRVIFDSPPVGAVADPLILGTQTDGTVVVLKSHKTTKEAGIAMISALRDANVPIFGAVLNDVDLQSKRYGGYYAYYRNQGYYQADDVEETEVASATI